LLEEITVRNSGTKHPKLLWLLATVAVLALVAAACAPDEVEVAEDPDPVEEPDPDDVVDEPQEPPVDDDVITLTYASHIPPGGVIEYGTEWFIEELETRSDGRVQVEAFFGGALLEGAEIYRGIQDGLIDFGHVSQSRVHTELPLWGVVGLPWVTDNPEAMQHGLLEMFETDENFRAMFEQEGMVAMHFKPLLAEHSGFNEPFTSLDQLQGLRLRGLGGPVNSAYGVLGADMVDVPTPEIFESLQRGTIDGFTQQTIDLSIGNSLHEVSPYFVEAQIGSVFPVGNLMRIETWEALPPDIQDLILELNNEYPAASIEEIPQIEEESCDALLEAGGSVTRIPDDEVQAWRDQVEEQVVSEWVAETAQLSGLSEDEVRTFLDNYIAAVERAEAESEYVNGLILCAERS
jgi:TRAP-type transport system periplasmic protein